MHHAATATADLLHSLIYICVPCLGIANSRAVPIAVHKRPSREPLLATSLRALVSMHCFHAFDTAAHHASIYRLRCNHGTLLDTIPVSQYLGRPAKGRSIHQRLSVPSRLPWLVGYKETQA